MAIYQTSLLLFITNLLLLKIKQERKKNTHNAINIANEVAILNTMNFLFAILVLKK
jgi:hypothetical protein